MSDAFFDSNLDNPKLLRLLLFTNGFVATDYGNTRTLDVNVGEELNVHFLK